MKTAISLPDAIYAEAERLARRLNKSRSQLYAEAVAAFLRRYDTDALTESFDVTDAWMGTQHALLLIASLVQ